MPFVKGHKLAKGGARPGAGRKPSEVRQLCARVSADNIPVIAQIISKEKARDADRISAWKALATVGFGDLTKIVGEEGHPPVSSEIRNLDQLIARIGVYIADPANSD